MQSPIKVFQISSLEAVRLCSPPSLLVSHLTLDGRGRMTTERAFFAPTGSRNMLHQIESGSRRQRGFCTVTDSMWRWLKYVCAHVKIVFWK